MKIRCLFLLLLAAAGCDNSLAVNLPAPAEPGETSHDQFDPQRVGTISGRVTWAGGVPTVEPIRLMRFEARGLQVQTVPNPNAPRVSDRGVQSAILFLRGVDPRRAKAMAAVPTTVEAEPTRLSVVQNGVRHRTAFVPVGAEVSLVSKLDGITGIRGRGANFFTAMLPEANAESHRALPIAGRVELTSAGGHYWMLADLFVCEHAYYARTDDAGRFALPDVPEGEYELVCWHPNWHIVGVERDPETALMVRQLYAPAVEKVVRVRVTAHGTATAEVTLTAADFVKHAAP